MHSEKYLAQVTHGLPVMWATPPVDSIIPNAETTALKMHLELHSFLGGGGCKCILIPREN